MKESEIILNEDFTKIPTRLDAMYEQYDKENVVRPTIINVSDTWTKTSQKALVSHVTTTAALSGEALMKERNAAFDLLDALTRSGGMVVDDTELHVVIAATHNFDDSLMNSIVCENKNPIESVERSSLIMLSTLHKTMPGELVAASQMGRLNDLSREVMSIGDE